MVIDNQTGMIQNPYEGNNPYEKDQLEAYLTPAPIPTSNYIEDETQMAYPHWQVKSITKLDRIFMIDVSSKGLFKV
tara:strand:- start:259 stop:486 length:228 start_codon:yes stop_codon:yes gene_type:complete